MFIIPGVLGLIAFIFLKPQEFVDSLRALPFLYIFFALALAGFAADLASQRSHLRLTPQLPWVIAFALWCLLTVIARAPGSWMDAVLPMSILVAIYVVLAHGVQTLRAFEALAAVLLASTLFVAVVTTQQGSSDRQCVAFLGVLRTDNGEPDGRGCETSRECYEDAPEPDADYRCERVGALGTTTIGGRVRYVGTLHDPNETALAVALGIPLALGFYQRRRTTMRLLLAGATVVTAATVTVLSQSRSGLLVFLTVLAVYFLQRYRWRGLVASGALALPVLLLGGRSGEEAASSSSERVEILLEGLRMIAAFPFVGVGYTQFTAHHDLTAHNSFLLAPAELGIVGALAWSGILYLSVKIPVATLRAELPLPQPEQAALRTWALTLLSALSGIVVGSLFLSFNYHHVLWVFVGLSAALFSVVRRAAPGWNVPFGRKDLLLLLGLQAGVLVALFLYARRYG